METKIDVVEILKNKPQGTKLYDWLHNIDVELDTINITNIGTVVWCTDITNSNTTCRRCYSEFGTECNYPDGLQILFPSKEMPKWYKFSWKKGDVLISKDGKRKVLFSTWANNNYTKFIGLHCLITNDNEEVIYDKGTTVFNTNDFKSIDIGLSRILYIKTIEERLGGKLNIETLEIEPAKSEFKDGDIITIMPHIGDKLIYLFKAEDDEKYYGCAFLDGDIVIVNDNGYVQKDFCTARPSTEEEKQMFFDALAKEGKSWDAEKKHIVDIKKEPQFKPFEKVLVRDSYDDMWRACFFSHIREDDGRYVTTCFTWKFCIPYIGNEHLLGTTKDVEG